MQHEDVSFVTVVGYIMCLWGMFCDGRDSVDVSSMVDIFKLGDIPVIPPWLMSLIRFEVIESWLLSAVSLSRGSG